MSYEAEIEFYKTLDSLQAERDDAFASRKDDPERWQAAKHAYAEFRTGMRVLAGRTTNATVQANIVPQTADVGVAGSDLGA